MFIIKKFITPFLLPPGLFITLLFLAGLYFLLRKDLRAWLVNWSVGVMIWVFSLVPVSDALLRGLESGFPIQENSRGDVIILLGGGAYDSIPDISGTGGPAEETLVRIVAAVRLQKKLGLPVIISGGAAFEGIAEAPIVKRFLVDLGVPEKKIIIEDKSRDTRENAVYSTKICQRLGFSRPLLVTSALHMKRSLGIFHQMGLKAIPFPSGFKTWEGKRYGPQDYLPDASALRNSSQALHEYLGLLYYRVVY